MPRYPVVVDADGHVQEPAEMWPKYLEKRYHLLAPCLVTDSQGKVRRQIAGSMMPHIAGAKLNNAAQEGRAGGYDPRARLTDMDSEGIDIAVLFPSTGLFFAGIEQLDVQAALCRAYNDWVYDYRQASPARLVGIAMAPQTDITEALVETRRAHAKLGCHGLFLRPNPVGGRTLDDPYFEPLWTLLEELDTPLAVHEGTTQNLPEAGLERYQNFLFRHAVSHPHEQQMACMELICGGVLERHPKLRVVFLESGCGWIAHWIERLDHHMKYWGHTSLPLKLKPSEYFARQCFISADPDEAIIPGIVETLGADTLVFASDYPHPDGVFPGVVAELADREDLDEKTKAKILGTNALRLFGVPAPKRS